MREDLFAVQFCFCALNSVCFIQCFVVLWLAPRLYCIVKMFHYLLLSCSEYRNSLHITLCSGWGRARVVWI